MIRRSPGEFYLRYLVVHPDRYSNEYIMKSLGQRLGLDTLGEWYLNQLRASCIPPVPFYPFDPLHFNSQKFLRKEQIHRAFQPDEAMIQALILLDRAKLRELVEVMVLSGAPDEAVVYALDRRRHHRCSLEAIKVYRHYFWNTELLDTTEIRALLNMRFEGVLDSRDPHLKVQFSALNKVKHSDPRMAAARLPASPLTSIVAQMQMGIMPRSINLAEVVEATRTTAAIRALEATMTGGPTGSEMARNFSATAETMSRMMETLVRPEDQLRADLANIALKTDASEIPLLTSLSGGHHTVDLQPEPKAEDSHEHRPGQRKSSEG